MQIEENLKRILSEIGPDVTLVAATKMNDTTRVQEAIAAGLKVCGENRVQEMLEKNAQGAYKGADLQFIGHLQKNKVKNVVGLCSLIQSVDSLELLQAIDHQAQKLDIVQDVLLEINIGHEEAKSGFNPGEIYEVIGKSSVFSHVYVKGLMAVPPACTNPVENDPYFAQMHQIFVDISRQKYDNVSMAFLSMGMTSDYLEAIKYGANMVRVGSGIFGPRHYDSAEVK